MKVRLSKNTVCFIISTILCTFLLKGPVARAQVAGPGPYVWIDVSSKSGRENLTLGDDDFRTVDLESIGFHFSFLGEPLTQLKISSNGYLTFGNNDAAKWSNEPLADSADPNKAYTGNPGDIIAPLWADLDPATGGAVYYLVDRVSKPARLIVEWHDIPMRHYTGEIASDTVTFEVILYEESNEIVFQYKDVITGSDRSTRGACATIGLKYHNQTVRQYSYNTRNALSNGMAVSFNQAARFVPQVYQGTTGSTPGGSTEPGSGTTPGSGTAPGSSTIPSGSTEPGSGSIAGSSAPPGSSPPPAASTIPVADTTPASGQNCEPIIEAINPPPNSTNISVNPKITLNIRALCGGLDRNSIRLFVDGRNVTSAATIADTSQGLTLSYRPNTPLACSTIIPVRVEASDQSGHSATRSYFLYSEDSCKPYLTSSNPPDQSCVPANATFTYGIGDLGSGVDIGSVHLTVNGSDVTAKASITATDEQGCLISYTSAAPFEKNQRVSVRITASDYAVPPNSMEAVFEYMTCYQGWTYFWLDRPVSDLALDKKGILWAATLGAGLFKYSPKADGDPLKPVYWTDYHPVTGLPGDWITCLAGDKQGNLWLCAQPDNDTGGGVVKFDPDKGTVVKFFPKGQNGLPDDPIHDLAIDPNDGVWVATQNHGVFRLYNQQWKLMFDTSRGLTDNWVKAIAPDDAGNIWLATEFGDIFKFNSANQLIYSSNLDSSFSVFNAYGININSLFFDPVEDTLWVATGDGAYHYRADRAVRWSKVTGLASKGVNAIFPVTRSDYPGEKYWFAADGGIFATTDWKAWKSYTAQMNPYSSPDDQIRCIQQDASGNLWFGTDSGVSRLDITPPVVKSITPNPDATEVSLSQDITITFSEPMDFASLLENITITPDDPNFTVKPSPDLTSITFQAPKSKLAPKTTYQISIDQGVMDLSGNQLSSARSSSFVTQQQASTTTNTSQTTSYSYGIWPLYTSNWLALLNPDWWSSYSSSGWSSYDQNSWPSSHSGWWSSNSSNPWSSYNSSWLPSYSSSGWPSYGHSSSYGLFNNSFGNSYNWSGNNWSGTNLWSSWP
ncbi:MAG: Ig-like domain-containing protein [bacterium]